ncbi:MAG TPA: M48 family metallopeptidase, partial [Blastocatellia bacterium]
ESKHLLLRRCYRGLITAGGLYYFLSMPFVLLLVLGVAGALVYGCFEYGWIPIKLVLFVVIGALVTSYSMIRSLLIRRTREEPGRPLRVEEAPGMWGMATEVAGRVGTRTVDEIRVTPGTEMAVYETGSFKDRANDKGRRVLIVGIGLLNGFSQKAFRAVLAHEYGHLTHRDTAGGDVALKVNQNMREFAMAMVRARQAVWWNLAFQFLRVYHFIFRRLSHGATRFQEVLADKVAVMNYGAVWFEEGLRHVIRRGIEFEDAAYRELADAKNTRRVVQNLYSLESGHTRNVEDRIRAAINRPTTEDDTHPGPLDRFRYASRITSVLVEPIPGTLWDLFTDKETLTREMSTVVSRRAGAMPPAETAPVS